MFREVSQPQVHSTSLPVWRQRLSHANLESVKQVLYRQNLYFSNKCLPTICANCCLGKMHKLPFLVSNFQASNTLDLIYSDV
ncbi:hypothetical protein LINPERHAP2_LOCUS37572 [Linum perenne]